MIFREHFRIVSKFGTISQGFSKGAESIGPGQGETALRKAIVEAVSALVAFSHDASGLLFPNSILRLVLVLDCGSAKGMLQLLDFLRDSGVVIDLISFRKEKGALSEMVQLCHMSGGSAVCVDSEATMKKFVTSESFLNVGLRPPIRWSRQGSTAFDDEFPNETLSRAAASVPVRPIAKVTPPSNLSGIRQRRLMQEIKYAVQNDPSIQVFVAGDRIDEWRVFIKGPDRTPYAGKWWYLFVTFPLGYPQEPPVFRFISVPFHVNISPEGRIGLNLLEAEYEANQTVFGLLVCIQALLQNPNYQDPINADRRRLADTSRGEFERRGTLSANRSAKDSVQAWLQYLKIG
jgi:ubiquitin-protein ligase